MPSLKETILEAQPDDILELDELWSFVYQKTNQQWLWSALCRRTRQIVAYQIGDRSINTCRRLYGKIPYEYRKCHSFSDFWKAYKTVIPEETHQCVGKDGVETAHMERWYNTLRQRNARYARKTLSFSKSETWHHIVTKLIITNFNLHGTT